VARPDFAEIQGRLPIYPSSGVTAGYQGVLARMLPPPLLLLTNWRVSVT